MDIFSALADPTRRTILEMLSQNGELSATDISKRFHMSGPAVSQHLKILRQAQLVSVEKQAQKRMYMINQQKLSELEHWFKKVTGMWNERFDRLDALLAKEKEVKLHGK